MRRVRCEKGIDVSGIQKAKLTGRIRATMLAYLQAPFDEVRIWDPFQLDVKRLQVAAHQAKPDDWEIRTRIRDGELTVIRLR